MAQDGNLVSEHHDLNGPAVLVRARETKQLEGGRRQRRGRKAPRFHHRRRCHGEKRARARRRGAHGIGLCRTEHQFLGDRRVLIERLVLAGTVAEREEALEALRPLERADFTGLLEAMDALPVTVRLVNPPLHEFLPDRAELMVRVERRGAGRNGR